MKYTNKNKQSVRHALKTQATPISFVCTNK